MEDAADRLRESLYTAVGFGVLGFQQAQVRRRQLRKDLSKLAAELDERLDPVLDDFEARLSDEMRPLLAQARSALRSAQRSLLDATSAKPRPDGPPGPGGRSEP